MEFVTRVGNHAINWRTVQEGARWILYVGTSRFDITNYASLSDDDESDLINADIANAVDSCVTRKMAENNVPLMEALTQEPARIICADPSGTQARTRAMVAVMHDMQVDVRNWRYRRAGGEWQPLPDQESLLSGDWMTALLA